MNRDFNVLEFVDLIKRIKKNSDNLQSDLKNQDLYYKLKDSLEELYYLIDNRLLPSDLQYRTEKFYYGIYRLTEGTYKGKRERRK